MRLALALTVLLAVTNPARAEVQRFYLHHGDPPVAVPGGTSSFFLDQSLPSAPAPVVEQNILDRDETATFPTFTATPLATDTTLLPIASVRLFLAANQKMRSCATVDANLFTVDADGVQTANGGAVHTDATIEQAASGGTEDLESIRVEFAVSDLTVPAGQGLALATSLTNHCSIKRRTFFAYDGDHAAARVQFQCCFTTAAKCGAKKIQSVLAATYCHVASVARESHAGKPDKPGRNLKCDLKMSGLFTKYETRGGCLTTADAPEFTALLAAFAGDLDATLDPLGPNRKNRCQEAKIRAANDRMNCLLKLEARAAQSGLLLDPDPLKIDKCRLNYAAKFAKGEAKGGCDTSGDADTIAAKVDAFVTTVSSRLTCPCP